MLTGSTGVLPGLSPAEFARWFCEELPLPAVILHMPGCEDVLVNQAHAQRFGKDYFRVSPSVEACVKEVLGLISGQLTINGISEQPWCYCDKPPTKSAIAVRGDMCPFESAFKELSTGGRDRTSRLAFLGLKQEQGQRTYEVFRVDSSLLASQGDRQHMESQLRPLGRVVKVTTETSVIPASATPRLSVSAQESTMGNPLWTETFTIPTDEDYQWFNRLLSESIKSLEDGKLPTEVLHNMLGLVKKRASYVIKNMYEPLEGYIRHRFSENDLPTLIIRLRDDSQRLFDAIVLNSEVQKRFEAELLELLPVQKRQILIQMGQKSGEKYDKTPLQSSDIQSGDSTTTTRESAGSSFSPNSVSGKRAAPSQGRERPQMHLEQKPSSFLEVFEQHNRDFEQILPKLLGKYSGQFVAFFEGKVIDSDKEERVLVDRVRIGHKSKKVLIRRVADHSDERVYLDTLGM